MKNLLVPCVAIAITTLTIGCNTPKQASVRASVVIVREHLTIHDGRTGDTINWTTMLSKMGGADVIILGEQHDDATGHAVQLAVVEDILDQSPGRGGVALEMLERDEQVLLDDYRDKIIDAKTFAELSASTSWAGKGSWKAWYQPIIDAAIERGAVVIAANAPRRYVRLARMGGWERLDELDANRRELVDHPDTSMTGAYRDRFIEFMGGSENIERAESFFRSQQVWDATMAASVSDALRQSGPPVILLVGRFHSDSNGGTPRQIRRLCPSANIVTVSLVTTCHTVEFSDERPLADFVVCTETEDSP